MADRTGSAGRVAAADRVVTGGRTPRRARRAGRALLAGAAGLALLLPAGCGVPDSGPPVDVGPGPNAGGVNSAGQVLTVNPDDAPNPTELVRSYLAAGAGMSWVPSDGAPRPKDDDVSAIRRFMTGDATAWQPGSQITVVNVGKLGPEMLDADGSGARTIDVPLYQVGVLTSAGVLEPRPATLPTWKATVVDVNGAFRFSKPPPNGILLSNDVLANRYQAQPVWFWDDQGRTLVPDLRYLPVSVTGDKRATQIVDWLLKGPSEWLRDAVTPLPDRTQRLESVFTDKRQSGSPLVVNLSGNAANVDLAKLSEQLLRSLASPVQPLRPSVQIKIEGQSKGLFSPREPVPGGDVGGLLVVVNGKVRRQHGDPMADAILSSDQNSAVLAAALTAQARAGALVRTDPHGARLWVGAEQASGGTFTATALAGRQVGRPAYLAGGTAHWLVPVEGRLHLVSLDGQQDTVLPVTGVSSLVDVSTAPDGRRVAFVADGQVFLATVLVNGDAVALSAPVPVPTGLSQHTAVVWSGPDQLAVSGRDEQNNGTVAWVNVDGGMRSPLDLVAPLRSLTVSRLTVEYSARGSGRLFVQAGNQAYEVFRDQMMAVQPGKGPEGEQSGPVSTVLFPG